MRSSTYILIIFAGLIGACNPNDSRKSATSSVISETDILERLKYQKAKIDTVFNHSKNKLIVIAKLVDNDTPVNIFNGNFPANVETTFNILKDNKGQIIAVAQFPFSESGDWDITYTHYFDKDGKTFAFERQTNFFNSICTDGVAYETRTELYNSQFKRINSTYKLVDEKKNTAKRQLPNAIQL